MNSVCAVCAASDSCPYYGAHDEGNFEQCDEILAILVEDGRSEYRKAWEAYIKKFNS